MAESTLSITLRPKTFKEIIGHTAAVAAIKAAIDADKIPVAYMFTGPAGTGKTTLARLVARAVQGWAFAESDKPDVLELNAAHFTGVDGMRDLITKTSTYPFAGTYRVIILDEAHQLSKPAQNLLLKPLEDPDSATRWIICTTETGKILPAIRTRCTTFELGGLDSKERHALLARAAEAIGRLEPFDDFEKEVTARGLQGPRALLQAFEQYSNGIDAASAVSAQTAILAPEYHEIALAVVYGQWDKPSTIWGGKKQLPSLQSMLVALDEKLKKQAKESDKEDKQDIEDVSVSKDDEQGRPEVSRGLRAVTAAFLKGAVLKGNGRAAESLNILAHCTSPNPFDAAMEYPATIAGLYRVNAKMQGK